MAKKRAARRFTGTVIDDNLFKEYHNFKKGLPSNTKKIERLIHYLNHRVLTNVAQYERTGIELDDALKSELAKNGLINQDLESLARDCSKTKIILSTASDTFPRIDILNHKTLESNYTASFNRNQERRFAKEHIKAMCADATEIMIYDNYLKNDPDLERLLKNILPRKPLKIKYNDFDSTLINKLKAYCGDWDIISDSKMQGFHDRYLIINREVEIILSSGLDNLATDKKDLTYVVRMIDSTRFD